MSAMVQPFGLAVLPTYQCTARCEQCCVAGEPGSTARLSLDEILSFIEEGSRFPSVRLVTFSGGECFLLGANLVGAVAFASGKGLKTRCVTNGYWAKTMSQGRRRLQRLKDAGLSELNISTGDRHQQWVSEKAVVNAACLGVELGLDSILISVELQKERHVTMARLLDNRRLRQLYRNRAQTRFRIIESPWMPMHASATIAQAPETLFGLDTVRAARGCKRMFTTVVLTPQRRIGFCCGLSRELIPELNGERRGRSLAELLESAGTDFMKIWIFVDGPQRILAWAATKDPRIVWERRYAHHCHACLALFQDPRVRRTIAGHYRERVHDVLVRYSLVLGNQELQPAAAPPQPMS
jgi:Radical SAM superfamily